MSAPQSTHAWEHYNSLSTASVVRRVGSTQYELRPGEGITLCGLLSSSERPLIGTSDAELADCRDCVVRSFGSTSGKFAFQDRIATLVELHRSERP